MGAGIAGLNEIGPVCMVTTDVKSECVLGVCAYVKGCGEPSRPSDFYPAPNVLFKAVQFLEQMIEYSGLSVSRCKSLNHVDACSVELNLPRIFGY